MNEVSRIKYEKYGISVFAEKIEKTTFKWKKGATILFVLRGSINLQVYKDLNAPPGFILNENQVYILGDEEIYRAYADVDNAVLVMHIDYSRLKSAFSWPEGLDFDIPELTYNRQEKIILKEFKEKIIEIANRIIKNESGDEFEDEIEDFIEWLIFRFEIISRKLTRKGYKEIYFDKMYEVTGYIQENFNETNILEKIGNMQYMNKGYVSHLLKELLDSNYRQLINFYRVGASIKLLINSNYNISEISEDCGFSATRYFYKEFKKFYPDGPSFFRKQYKNSLDHVEMKNVVEELAKFEDKEYSEPYILDNQYILLNNVDDDNLIAEIERTGERCLMLNSEGKIIGVVYLIR